MGERLHGMQEVVGSNPIGSIFHFYAVCQQIHIPVLFWKQTDFLQVQGA